MPIEGTSVSYATNIVAKVVIDNDYYAYTTPQRILHVGAAYYLNDQGIWFTSANARGPWERSDSVPKEVVQIECEQLGSYQPLGAYQLCAAPAPELYENVVVFGASH
jgi:hypothetical protein